MRFKILTVLLIFACCLYDSTLHADTAWEAWEDAGTDLEAEGEHFWKEFGYAGLGAGTYNVADSQGDYFFSGLAFYHNQLAHDHPQTWTGHVSDWGVLGLASYLTGMDSDFFVTGQFSKGLWLDRTALLQLSAGPSWSEKHSWGASSTLYLSYQWSFSEDTINAGAIYIQNYIYADADEAVGIKFLLGISIGVGALNEVR